MTDVERRLSAVERRLGQHEGDLREIYFAINRIDERLDEHGRRLTAIDATLLAHTDLLSQILDRLPKKPSD